MTTSNQPSELDKALGHVDHDFAEDNRPLLITVMKDDLRILYDAAKRLKEVEKERDELRDSLPKCGSCAEDILCGGHMHPHDDDCVYTQLSTLRTEYKNALGALNDAEDHLAAHGIGFLMPVRKRIAKVLSTPLAISMKGEG